MAAQGDDCYFYYYSTCSKGDSCQFRHCQEALGNEVVCSLWREGRCHRTICYYRHMEIDKNRSVIPCYWESQPTGCLKQHCPFKHMKPRGLDTASWASSPTKLTTDVRNTLTSGGSVPVKKAVPPPVVEPVVVTAGEESDETSSVEVSPVKKLKFPTSSLLSSVKEEEQKSSEAGELNFGIKTLSQIREKNPREYKSLQNTTIVAGGQPGDQRKIVSLKGTSSSLPEGDKLSSVDQSGVALEKEGPTVLAKKRQRITFNTGEKTSLTTRRKLITSETEEKPVVISLNSGKDGAVKMEEDSSTEIKSLSQIRQERFQRSIQLKKLGLAGQGDGGIKTLAQIRREKKAKLGMKIAEQGDAAIVGRVENMETEKMSKEESGIGDGSDYGVKSLDEIRKERLLKYSSGEGDGDVTGVKSLEQIRRERIANRLGLKTDKENSVTSATVETDSQNKTLRTSVLSRLGKSESQNTVHQRLTPLVKNDSHTERGRKIQLKEPREIQSLQSDSQLLSRKIVSVKPEVTKSSEEPVVKTKKRRVFVMGNADETDGQVEKTADEKEDEEVNRSLPKSRIRVGRLAMDGAAEKDRPLRASEDSEESENNAAKEETKSKRILIKRNEGKLTKPLKRRADRQIYQPPGAKSKERASSIRSRLGQNTETEKFDEENKDGEEEKNKETMVRKRPRITFHTDATSDLAESNNSQKNADSRLSNAETSEGRKTIKSGTVRIRPVPKSPKEESEHSEPVPPKKIKGGGLRERLLKQSEKFTVGVVGGKLDSTSLKPQASGSEGKNARRHLASEHVVGDSVKGPASGRVEPAEVSIGVKTFQETHDSRTDLGLAEGEQTVVSSSESSVLSDRHLEDTEKRNSDVGNVDSIPSNLSLSITSGTKSVSPSNSILPDSTNQIIPSVEVGQPKTISSSQPLEANANEPGTRDGKVQKEPNSRSNKARMSITDDDLENLLDDVDDIGGPDQFEDDDDDALLNELEDLINA